MAMNNNDYDQEIDTVFSYQVKKDNKVLIYWYEKLIKILSGENAKKFLDKIEDKDQEEAQLIMAKTTGNIKRGKSEDTNTIVIRGTRYTKNKR